MLHIRARSGFTLVEILVTITILVSIITLATFSYEQAVRRGEITKVQSDLRTIADAMLAYHAEFGYFPPDGLEHCSLCAHRAADGSEGSDYGFDVDDWELVADELRRTYLPDAPYTDPWGNYYGFDENYYTSGASNPSMLCSVGPNGDLETFVEVGSPGDATYLNPEAQGDDICLILEDVN